MRERLIGEEIELLEKSGYSRKAIEYEGEKRRDQIFLHVCSDLHDIVRFTNGLPCLLLGLLFSFPVALATVRLCEYPLSTYGVPAITTIGLGNLCFCLSNEAMDEKTDKVLKLP